MKLEDRLEEFRAAYNEWMTAERALDKAQSSVRRLTDERSRLHAVFYAKQEALVQALGKDTKP